MTRSPPSCAPFATPSHPDGALVLQRQPGRLRAARHWLMLAPVLVGSWIWFGVTGSILLLLWWWHRRPARGAGCWHIELDRVRAARLGPWRTWIERVGAPPLEIFSDEVDPADLAALRRALKG